MKKYYIVFILLISIILLCSCNERFGGVMIYDDSEKKADLRMEQILDAIQNQDYDGLKGMFSKQVLSKSSDFDDGMDYLFGMIQGKVESWERYRFGSDGERENGKKSTRVICWYTVTTDKDKYKIYMADVIVDTINPDNAGLYALYVFNEDETNKELPFEMEWPYKELLGIYQPEQ